MKRRVLGRLVARAHRSPDAGTQRALENAIAGALEEDDAGRVFVASEGRGDAAAVVTASEVRGARAWLLGVAGYDAGPALERVCAALAEAGARELVTAGPPGGYLRSGIDANDAAEVAWFVERGFTERSRHVDLRATLAPPSGSPGGPAVDSRVRRARRDESAALAAWIARSFAPAWAREARRALNQYDALFVVPLDDRGDAPGDDRDAPWLGFAANSGTNAALGTFGPLGVVPSARRAGLGAALARAALDDLAARGFARATIPWVDPALVGFYRALVASLEVRPRVVLARPLAPSAAV